MAIGWHKAPEFLLRPNLSFSSHLEHYLTDTQASSRQKKSSARKNKDHLSPSLKPLFEGILFALAP